MSTGKGILAEEIFCIRFTIKLKHELHNYAIHHLAWSIFWESSVVSQLCFVKVFLTVLSSMSYTVPHHMIECWLSPVRQTRQLFFYKCRTWSSGIILETRLKIRYFHSKPMIFGFVVLVKYNQQVINKIESNTLDH